MSEEIKSSTDKNYEGFDKIFMESANIRNTGVSNGKLFEEFINVLFDKKN